jgi:hypothetical protein
MYRELLLMDNCRGTRHKSAEMSKNMDVATDGILRPEIHLPPTGDTPTHGLVVPSPSS